MRVVDFLEDYAHACSSGQMGEAADHFDVPVSFIQPDGTRMIRTREALLSALDAWRAVYAAAGMVRLRGSGVEEVGFDEGLGILNVRWEMYLRDGTLLTTVGMTYVLRQRDELLRVGAVIDHNDSERRKMLGEGRLRASATAPDRSRLLDSRRWPFANRHVPTWRQASRPEDPEPRRDAS
ncbi:MAG: hypothetical protein AAFN17_02030 [Pseudomonadota bacterium]